MGYIQGTPREQVLLFAEVLDEYVEGNNPVRFIEAYVDQLDVEGLGFERAEPAGTGRPAYDPKDLLKLYLYGYMNRVRSSRRLEQECARNVEVMWLLRKLRPDFKTIADFRRANRRAFTGVFRDFVTVCRGLGLFGGELVAIDGSKFKAQNNRDRNYTDRVLKRKIREVEERIERYLDELDRADEEEGPAPKVSAEELKEKIGQMKKRHSEYKALRRRLAKTGETQVSLTDPDSRAFPDKFNVDVGYNAQVAVDEKHHLIAVQDVTNAVTDIDHLGPMALATKEALGVKKLKVVADAGYCNSVQVTLCEREGIEAYTPRIPTSRNRKAGLYSKEMFRYDAKKRCYWCPAGKKLPYRFDRVEKWRHRNRRIGVYEDPPACRSCARRARCTIAPHRRIIRPMEDDAIDRMQERIRAHPEIMRKRQQIVEHPMGTIKFWNDQRAFLTRGLASVRGEFSLSALAYNIKRAINLLGVERLVAAVS